jgi:hypothetical protein
MVSIRDLVEHGMDVLVEHDRATARGGEADRCAHLAHRRRKPRSENTPDPPPTSYFARRRPDGLWEVAADRSATPHLVVSSRAEAEHLARWLTDGRVRDRVSMLRAAPPGDSAA